MRAARFDRASLQLTVQDVPVPQPGPDEVLVRVEAAGICGSDVHMIKGEFLPPLAQVTPGHEVAGTIAQTGAEVPVDRRCFWRRAGRVRSRPLRP
ncbi:alcohol dehydrogenase catalytic domain-containing protein [Methylobacter sp. YRD-M1]|uniref:alcohol dehydrogenase catalytic domain-containing protein n=1 Tax=Methylobacter sp. YRD-M1 TaxID=2911520 RepID=UPI003FA35E05